MKPRDEKRRRSGSNVDPHLPYWIRQAAEFSGALGRTARRRGPLAAVAWVVIIVVALTLLVGWIIQLRS